MADPGIVAGACMVCGSFEIETDYSKGEAVCNSCGVVQEEELITNSVQYEAGTSGHNTLVGRNVNLGAEGYLGQTGNPLKGGIARSSKDSTLSKNEDRLRGLGTQSKCGADICSHGFRVYKMAYEAGMTRKRPLETVLCACLYIASRRMKTGHMMADFVHLLNGDFFDLSKTVRFFITRLCISVPMLDPIMQVERFCHELVQDRLLIPKLVNLAHRVVERMKKDWIDAGRKPGAIAAAAVIIACRVNNYEVELEKVAQIAQVSGITIRRRLIEFAQTESARLLPSQFETEDLPRAQYHPCILKRGKTTEPVNRSMDKTGLKNTAKVLKKLLQTTLALGQKEQIAGSDDVADLQHSLICLNTSIEMTETRWQLVLEKSLFIATDLKVSITDDEFEVGKNIVCHDLLKSMMTNKAEQEIRLGNLQNKHGVLLAQRADKKREAQLEESDRPRKQARKKAAKLAQAGRPTGIPKPAEVQKSNKIDYDRFNEYLKDDQSEL